MKVYLLGTGTSQGVPVIGCNCKVCTSSDVKDNRLRSCVVIELEGTFILIDTGPDLRQQLLSFSIPRIDAILYTHEHNDHVVGLDDIRPYNFKQKTNLPIYGLPRVVNEVVNRFHYAFSKVSYPGAPRAVAYPISGEERITVANIEIVPIQIRHGKLDILGFRVNNFAFITDASYIAESEFEKLEDLEVLVINALRKEQHPSHFNLSEAKEVIHRLKPRRAFITHVSHYMGLTKEWEKTLQEDVFAAYDGLVLDF